MSNTTLCYIERDGKYLMLHRTKKKADINAGKWIGIGGHLEVGESPHDALYREVFEETGLTLQSPSYRGIITFVYGDTTEYMHLFTCDAFSGTLRECDEGELAWIDKSRIYELPLWEGDRVFLEKIVRPCPFFSLKLVYDESGALKQTIFY